MTPCNEQLLTLLQQYTQNLTPDQLASLHVQCTETIHTFFDGLQPPATVSQITAEEITVEVRDQKTGLLYRRQLPVDYLENGNGIRLGAEDFNGKPAGLVFYASGSAGRIHDLLGHGPDEDRCHTHS